MAREVGPSSQWNEPNPEKTGGVAGGLYPAQDPVSGVWGWTPIAAEAEGIIDTDTGVLGVDDTMTTGGQRVIAMGNGADLFVLQSS